MHSTNEVQQISVDVLHEKYAADGEHTPDDVRARVARALASNEDDAAKWQPVFEKTQRDGFVPAGRINAAAGSDLEATLVNCFVQPIADCMSGYDADGTPGITTALQEAAETMRRGGGVGYDFSPIRPKGAHVKGTNSEASGPISYMRMFDRMCQTVESAGSRRGAQMGVLRVDHPDIFDFVEAKSVAGELTNFNLSVGVTDAFMAAVDADGPFDLVHRRAPAPWHQAGTWYDAERRMWVYRRIRARELWDRIMEMTYDHAEPGVIFIDRINADNKLAYAEQIASVNPCSEQPLPPYGCCCLGSIDLTRFVTRAFTERANFDFRSFEAVAKVAVRMLDDVLDVTTWPLEQQRREAMNKRRIGLGILGLGDAAVMLGLRYDSPEARQFAANVACQLRDAAGRASIKLAQERGSFPAFDAEQLLASDYAQRLPGDIRQGIRDYGIRNSHLLSIAPTGTIALAFADNASNGIEPPFSWAASRKKREGDDWVTYTVEDHAYRVYREAGGDTEALPEAFVSALEIRASDHQKMVSAVAPYIDAAISKTVNVPADYPFDDFKELYREAYADGAKALATFRPNPVTGSILSSDSDGATSAPLDQEEPDRRIQLDELPQPALASLRWRHRPTSVNGNPARTYSVSHPDGKFAVSVGHLENGEARPFEVWVNGAEAPRGAAAIAKSLSMDLRTQDSEWVRTKLDSLSKVVDRPFEMPMPPAGESQTVPSTVAAIAQLVRHRCDELGFFDRDAATPVVDALMSRKEPKTGPNGTMCWGVDVYNPSTGDDCVVVLKELILPDGSRRPYSVWLSGNYPRALDGLAKLLSYDMRIVDPAWIGAKLRSLVHLPEPQGDFLAWVPGEHRQAVQPSTVAYIARVLIHRFDQLGILNSEGEPIEPLGHVADEADEPHEAPLRAVGAMETPGFSGRLCPECGAYALVVTGGCRTCAQCAYVGDCG